MTKLWFSAKKYGYGWYPSSREGWLVILWYLILILAPIGVISTRNPDALADSAVAIFFFPYMLGLTLILIWICVKKGEKARWRWGE